MQIQRCASIWLMLVVLCVCMFSGECVCVCVCVCLCVCVVGWVGVGGCPGRWARGICFLL